MKYFYILILFLTFTVRSNAQSVSSKFFTTLPKEVELQTGPLAKSLDSSSIESNYNRPIETIWASGSNTGAYNGYFYYSIFGYKYDINFSPLIKDELEKSPKKVSSELMNSYVKELTESIICKDGCNFLSVNGDTCLVGGNIAVPIRFTRKAQVSSRFKDDVFIHTVYLVPHFAKYYFIDACYLKSQESTWGPVLQRLNRDINFSQISLPESLKK